MFLFSHLAYLMRQLYVEKLWTPKYQLKLNKIIKIFLQKDAIVLFQISVCQSGIVHEGCWVNFSTAVGILEASMVCWREYARRVQLSGNQAAADCVGRVAVQDLVLSQEDKPKRHQSSREISRETGIPRSSVYRIIHCDLQLRCFKRRRAQLLSEASSVAHLSPW